MFDKELFYSICEKYHVELSDEYGKVMLKKENLLKDFTREDARRIIPGFQTYFIYNNFKDKQEQNVVNSYMPDELLTAC